MSQLKSYPLPPLFLTEVLERCRHDHEHRCRDWCAEDAEYCVRSTAENEQLHDTPVIISIEEGRGRHQCDAMCKPRCLRHCEDSDWVIELEYSTRGYRAVYGIKKKGDIQDVSLWMD